MIKRRLATLGALVFSSCMSLSFTTPTCAITSEPAGASFQLGEHAGITPTTIQLELSRHRIEFRAGLAGYLEASLSVLPKSGFYPTSLHVVFAKQGEGISTVQVRRDPRPEHDVGRKQGKNAPVNDTGDSYWLK